MMTETFCYFQLKTTQSRLTPQKMRELTGIEPDEMCAKGETPGRARRPSPTNYIIIQSGVDKYEHYEKHLKALLRKLRPYAAKIRPFSGKRNIWVLFCFAIYIDSDEDSQPGMSFTSKQLQEIAECGADLDLDLYILGDTPDRKQKE